MSIHFLFALSECSAASRIYFQGWHHRATFIPWRFSDPSLESLVSLSNAFNLFQLLRRQIHFCLLRATERQNCLAAFRLTPEVDQGVRVIANSVSPRQHRAWGVSPGLSSRKYSSPLPTAVGGLFRSCVRYGLRTVLPFDVRNKQAGSELSTNFHWWNSRDSGIARARM
jgi:hypothetical protein